MKKHKKIPILVLFIIILVLATGTFTFYFLKKDSTSNTPSSTSEVQINEKEESEDKVSEPITDYENIKSPKQNETAKNDLAISITSIMESDNDLTITSLINQITSSGKCTLTILDKAESKALMQKTSDIYPLPSSSTCKGFTIPIEQLQADNISISLKVDIDDKTATVTADYSMKK